MDLILNGNKEVLSTYSDLVYDLANKRESLPIYDQEGDKILKVRCTGCPRSLEVKETGVGDIFRMYRSAESIANIENSRELLFKHSVRPYMQVATATEIKYVDIKGIFFTAPNVSYLDVGMYGNKYYFVDFIFPEGLPYFILPDNRHKPTIFVLPIVSGFENASIPIRIVRTGNYKTESGEA